MDTGKLIRENDAFIFGFDNVLYPEKDFFLQVYYLFGQFVEYSEQTDAKAILNFMQQTYAEQGHEGIFEKTASHFDIPEKYKLNFDLLQRNVKLPLKLLLFEPCLNFLKAIVAESKPIFLLVPGTPEAQLNKIRQVDWQGLEQYLTVYFSEEIDAGSGDQGLSYLVDNNQLKGKNLLLVHGEDHAAVTVPDATLNYLSVDRLFLS
ncbi:haloacid dehalogenase [Pedobacter immunditicola]|uniref:haloacid dehalogenase n=1 Tax=Pedobacter immunditicola TaxID=3133440 RepID=UPI0030A8C167